MSQRRWQLEGDLRQAFENFCGGMVTGVWDELIEGFAAVVEKGELCIGDGARLDLLLRKTQGGDDGVDRCDVCHCPYPTQAHP